MDIDFVDTQLVYLIYGDDKSYWHEAKFSILTALRECSKEERPRILIYTNKPNEFSDWPVDLIYLTQEILKQYSGEQHYFHRCKAVVMLDALNYAKKSIFIDTDTFFMSSPRLLFDLFDNNEWIVDEIEAKWGDWHDQPLYKSTASFLKLKYGVEDDLILINSGVFGVKREAKKFMNKSIRLIDEIILLAPKIHIVEQFSASIAGYRLSRPAESNKIVRHYFGEKVYWREMLKQFFLINGENFSNYLVKITKLFPVKRPKPSSWKRLKFKIYTLGLSDQNFKALRLLYYAVNLNDDYKYSCSKAYLRMFLKKSLNANKSFDLNSIINIRSSLFSKKDISYIGELINSEGGIEKFR